MTRDLRLLAGAIFLSSAGDVLALIALSLQVHDLTGSGAAVAALMATTLVPVVLLAPLAGLVADRVESVRVIVVASVAQAAVAGALVFTGHVAAILTLSVLLATGNAFSRPAEFTLIPVSPARARSPMSPAWSRLPATAVTPSGRRSPRSGPRRRWPSTR